MYATSVLLYVLFRNIKFGGKLSIMVCVELILGNQGHEGWEGGGGSVCRRFPLPLRSVFPRMMLNYVLSRNKTV